MGCHNFSSSDQTNVWYAGSPLRCLIQTCRQFLSLGTFQNIPSSKASAWWSAAVKFCHELNHHCFSRGSVFTDGLSQSSFFWANKCMICWVAIGHQRSSIPPWQIEKSMQHKGFLRNKDVTAPTAPLKNTFCLYYRWYSCAASVGCFFSQFAQHSSSPWVSCSHQFLRIQAIIASLLLMCMHGTTKISGVCSKVITMYWELLLAKGVTAYYALPYHWKIFEIQSGKSAVKPIWPQEHSLGVIFIETTKKPYW